MAGGSVGRNKIETGMNLFGGMEQRDELLRDKFIEPPFSVLNARGDEWQNRKKIWLNKGLRSEVSREGIKTLPGAGSFGAAYGREGPMNSVSIFDPVLAELMYKWFCPPGGSIIDPFAGGSTRGIVAGYLGYEYFGVDLRPEQVDSNIEQAKEIIPKAKDKGVMPVWVVGDSEELIAEVDHTFDFLFTCPPYLDLEVYSNDPRDLSTMTDAEFDAKYKRIIGKAVTKIRPHSFAAVVVGDVRDKNGYYRGLLEMTKEAFKAVGWQFYNDAVLLQPLGTAMLRANRCFGPNRKMVKTHENILIFYKGDVNMIRERIKDEL